MGFPELPQPIQDQIDTLMANGPGHPMLAVLDRAWELIPEPTYQWSFYPQWLCQSGVTHAIDDQAWDRAEMWLARGRAAYAAAADNDIRNGFAEFDEDGRRLSEHPMDSLESLLKVARRDPDAYQYVTGMVDKWGRVFFNGDHHAPIRDLLNHHGVFPEDRPASSTPRKPRKPRKRRKLTTGDIDLITTILASDNDDPDLPDDLTVAWSLLPHPAIEQHPWAEQIAHRAVELHHHNTNPTDSDHITHQTWLVRERHAHEHASDDPDITLDHATARGEPPTDICDQIDELADAGTELFDHGDWSNAITPWEEALDLLPEPHTDHPQALWLHASIGDAYHSGGFWDEAIDQLRLALACPDGTDNPYIWLRLGQALQATGDTSTATNALLCAYILEGDTIFDDPDGHDRQLLADHNLL